MRKTPHHAGARDVRVSFFGDSFVAGTCDPAGAGWVGRIVAGAFAAGMPLTAYNLGVRRQSSTEVLHRWRAELQPRLTHGADCRVVFSFGANDAICQGGRPRVGEEESVANLERILAACRPESLSVLVVGPPPIDDAAHRARVSRLSAAYGDVAQRNDTPYVDVADILSASATWRRELAAGDGAHPGADGYALLATLVMPAWLDWLSSPPRG